MEPVEPHGDNIKHHRNRLGLTQAELATAVGSTTRNIARVEAGGNTSHKLIVALAAVLNVDRSVIEVTQ